MPRPPQLETRIPPDIKQAYMRAYWREKKRRQRDPLRQQRPPRYCANPNCRQKLHWKKRSDSLTCSQDCQLHLWYLRVRLPSRLLEKRQNEASGIRETADTLD